MDILVMTGQVILALSILVVLHECGHFFPAKWFGTRVEKFYLFFDAGFSLVKKKIGETEYGIGWLPLGGYVKIAGMIDESMDKEQMKKPAEPWEFRSKKAWQRLIIMLGGVFVNFILGFVLFAMVLWTWGRDYLPTSEAKFGYQMDSLMLKNGFRNGDLILQVGQLKLEKVDQGAFLKEIILNNARSCVVKRGESTFGVPISEEMVSEIQSKGMKKVSFFEPRMPFVIDTVVVDKPAEAAGFKKGDQIIGVNGISAAFYQDFAPIAKDFAKKSMSVSVKRGADTLNLMVTPDENAKIGIGNAAASKFFKVGHETYSLGQAIPQGISDGWSFLGDQMTAFGQMFRGKIKAKDNLGSFISIGKMYGPVWDWRRFWSMTASLSLILGFMNLLPIPALDGGYVMFLLWEVVTGKRVSDSFMEKAITVGFILMLGLMVVAISLDVMRNFF
jgi:regulator of sigma E protease